MAKRRFFEWNFDAGTVTEYERKGECNGCGQCCLAQIVYRVPQLTMPDPPPEYQAGMLGSSAGREGVWLEIREGEIRRFMSKPAIDTTSEAAVACARLSAEKQCSIHAFKDWKQQSLALCDVWPIHPDQVTPFSECSYSFVKIAEWNMAQMDEHEQQVQ